MSRSSRRDSEVKEFVRFTGATPREARRYLDRHLRFDIALQSYKNAKGDTSPAATATPTATATEVEKIFNKYKDRADDDITVDGTLDLCSDLGVDPEDVVLLAVAYELQSPSVGRWKRTSWVQGWKGLGVESFEGMKAAIPRLRKKLSADSDYFRRVYIYTFDFGRAEGQRSLPSEIALAFWGLLLPIGLKGGALRRQSIDCGGCGADDSIMKVDGGGWTEQHSQLWYDFLGEKNIKGISKDTWAMFLAFLRTMDAEFKTYDMEAAWPSTLDDFVEWARERLRAQGS